MPNTPERLTYGSRILFHFENNFKKPLKYDSLRNKVTLTSLGPKAANPTPAPAFYTISKGDTETTTFLRQQISLGFEIQFFLKKDTLKATVVSHKSNKKANTA